MFQQSKYFGKGPHGGYGPGTSRCETCHTLHKAAADSVKLLPAATYLDTCLTCHDGTGGKGVYGAIEARTGQPPGAVHGADVTSIIPGGDGAGGGAMAGTFSGQDDTLTCVDCHDAHDRNTVAAFRGERRRVPYTTEPSDRTSWQSLETNRLLRQRPGGLGEGVEEYGSDWCAACHAGRVSGAMVMNHPVDSLVEREDPFIYDNVARLASDGPTTQTVLGPLGGSNRGYLMPYPRTPEQDGHFPICQRCHEDSRTAGTLSSDGASATAAPFSTPLDGADPAGNPRFQNFPHETVNKNFLVTEADGLCLNCHPPAALP